MILVRNLLTAVIMSVMIILSATQADAAPKTTLNDAVGDIVTKLSLYLKSEGESRIAIGQFVGPPQITATSGPGIVKVFHDHFKKHNIEVVKRANIGLKGEYLLAKVTGKGIAVKIKGSLVDPFGDVLTDFTFDAGVAPGKVEKVIDGEEDIVQLLGVTTELHPRDRDSDRNNDLKTDILNPQLFIDGTQCGTSKESPYRVEILVGSTPRAITLDDGHGFVKLGRGDIYTVRIHNNSEYDAAVKLSIDGLSVFTFSDICEPDGTPKYKFYIVPAKSAVDLKGWHKTNELLRAFKVTGYDDSAASTINHTDGVGTITAVFSAAWPKDGTPPHDENFRSKGSPNATGFGPPVEEVVKEVEREIGRLRASISIRYSKPQ